MIQQKELLYVQAGSAITQNKGIHLSWRQFCSDSAEFFDVFAKHVTQLLDQRIGTQIVFKEVVEFLNLLKLGLTQY